MLVTKFESLSVDTDEVEQKEQIKDAALQDQFRKIFEIPKDEKLVSGKLDYLILNLNQKQ